MPPNQSDRFWSEFNSRMPATHRVTPITTEQRKKVTAAAKSPQRRKQPGYGEVGGKAAATKAQETKSGKLKREREKKARDKATARAVKAALPQTGVEQKKKSNAEDLAISKAILGEKAKIEKEGGGGGGGLFGFASDIGDIAKDVAGKGAGLAVGGATRALDVVQRPAYAVANVASQVTKNRIAGGGDPDASVGAWLNPGGYWDVGFRLLADPTEYTRAIKEGLTGETKGTFSDTTKQGGETFTTNLNPTGWGPKITYGTGAEIVMDVAMDPATYVSFGTASVAKKAIKEAMDKGGKIAAKGVVKEGGKYTAQQLSGAASRAGVAAGAKPIVKKKGAKLAESAVNIERNAVRTGIPTKQIADDVASQAAAEHYRKAVKAGVNPGQAKGEAIQAGVQAHTEKIVREAKQRVMDQGAKGLTHRLDVRVAGHSIIPDDPASIRHKLATLGLKPFTATKKKLTDNTVGQAVNKAFNTKYYHTGDVTRLIQKANSQTAGALQRQQKETRALFKGTTKRDQQRITEALEGGYLTLSPGEKGTDLNPILDAMRNQNREFFDDHVNLTGKYVPNDRDFNYVYHHYDNLSPKKIDEVRALRKKAINTATPFTLADAKAHGAKVYTNARDIMLAQQADHARSLQRRAIGSEMVDRFGLITKDPSYAKGVGMVEVKGKALDDLGIQVAEGHKVYLPEDVHRSWDFVANGLTRGGSKEANQALALFDKLQGFWKFQMTGIKPGYHMRNFMSDAFVNFMAGVSNPQWYRHAINAIAPQAKGRVRGLGRKVIASGEKIRVRNVILTPDEAKDLYIKSGAKSGFITSEVEGLNKRYISRKILNFSEGREDVSRMALFLYSLEQEMIRGGVFSKGSKGWDEAVERSAATVNHRLLDYGDITPAEKTVMRRLMPFYTYQRKMAPQMIQALWQRPSKMTAPNKVMNTIQEAFGIEDDGTGGDGPVIPDYIMGSNYAQLDKNYEPLIWQPDLPLNMVMGGQLGNQDLGENLRQNVLGKTNPLIRGLLEMGMQKDLFTGKEENIDLSDQIIKNLSPLQSGGQIAKAADFDPDTKLSWWNVLGSQSGVGTKRISEKQQLGELWRQNDTASAIISKARDDMKPFSVHKNTNGTYRIYNEDAKQSVETNLSEADAFGKALRYGKAWKADVDAGRR